MNFRAKNLDFDPKLNPILTYFRAKIQNSVIFSPFENSKNLQSKHQIHDQFFVYKISLTQGLRILVLHFAVNPQMSPLAKSVILKAFL